MKKSNIEQNKNVSGKSKNLEQTLKDKLIKEGISKNWMDKHLIIDMPKRDNDKTK
jgi:hypothetical protein|tara:strand:- start:225 stop:389 length:165 start_codon:yes stop_codon:yes gene_type:complete